MGKSETTITSGGEKSVSKTGAQSIPESGETTIPQMGAPIITKRPTKGTTGHIARKEKGKVCHLGYERRPKKSNNDKRRGVLFARVNG